MPTTITKTIGTAGADYTTLAAWAADTAAFTTNATFNLVTSDTVAVGQIITNLASSAQILHIPAATITDATHTITLTAGAGLAFNNNVNVLTNPLQYNGSNGIGVACTLANGDAILIETDFVSISNLQFNFGSSLLHVTANNFGMSNSIITGGNNSSYGGAMKLSAGLSGSVSTLNNCLFIAQGGSHLNNIIYVTGTSGATTNFNDCTWAVPSDIGTTGSWIGSIFTDISGELLNVRNNMIFGESPAFAGAATFAFTTSLTDATGTTGLTGGQTYSAQFQNTTVAAGDFRQLLHANGTPVSGVTTDIALTTRNVSTPNIGAWEVASPGSSTAAGYFFFGQSLGDVLLMGAGARLARDLWRNPIRSRRRLLSWKDDR